MTSSEPRGTLRIGQVVALTAILLVACAGGQGDNERRAGTSRETNGKHAAGETTRYHCPMHPTMGADKPGDCPICGMRMIADEAAQTGSTAAAQPAPPPRTRVIYRSTMNPGETSDRPGRDSMGMEMERVEVDEGPAGESGVEGRAAIRIPALKQQLSGVRTSLVGRVPFVRTIRTVGRVTPDETRLHHVHTKIEGWVETLNVNATGVMVHRGDPLLSIYSPEVVATQEEYLIALKARAAAQNGAVPELTRGGDDLLESTRRRLLLFDLTPAQIDALERTGSASRTVTLFAPTSGYVLQRNVTQGEKVDATTSLIDVADLSRVWVMGSVYEYELPFVRAGQQADVTLTYLPGRTYRGRVSLVYPTVDAASRTIPIRLEFPNPDLDLKPEMYADVQIRSDLGERLAVPSSAVLATGTRNIVFVALGEGSFQPREVSLGLRLPDAVEILSGVSEGERVVTSGNFLVDSESRLKATLEAAAPPPAKVH